MKIKKTRKVRQKRANVQVETFTKRSSEREQTKFKSTSHISGNLNII